MNVFIACSMYTTHVELVTYHTQEIFGGEKLANLVDSELFAKIFLTNIHRYTENVFGICTDCSLFTKVFLANSFYLYGSPKFSPARVRHCSLTLNKDTFTLSLIL